MQMSLFGGGIKGEVPKLLGMILDEIRYYHAKQVLLIPYARIQDNPDDPEWHQGWYQKFFPEQDPEIEFLDASKPQELAKADHPMIYISGGGLKGNVLHEIRKNSHLEYLIRTADFIVAESAGAKILASYCNENEENSRVIPGLNLVPNCVIEAHYFETQRQDRLRREVQEFGVKYGLGIDSNSGIRFDPKNLEVHVLLGNKLVELIED